MLDSKAMRRAGNEAARQPIATRQGGRAAMRRQGRQGDQNDCAIVGRSALGTRTRPLAPLPPEVKHGGHGA